jgi:nucleoside-diphosphate-sugar epimerase
MERVLIFGGAGSLGMLLLKPLLDAGHVVGLVTTSPLSDTIPDGLPVFKAQDGVSSALKQFGPTTVINLAAKYDTLALNLEVIDTIVELNIELCRWMRTASDVLLIHADSFFSSCSPTLSPLPLYSLSKALVRRMLSLSELPYVNLRFAQIYGHERAPTKLVPALFKQLNDYSEEIVIDSPMNIRDFIYCEDCIDLLLHIIDVKKHFLSQNVTRDFYVGPRKVITVKKFTEVFVDIYCDLKSIKRPRVIPNRNICSESTGFFPSMSGGSLRSIHWGCRYNLASGIRHLITQRDEAFRIYD